MRSQRAADDVLSALDVSDWGCFAQLYAGGGVDARLYAALLSLHGGGEAEATAYVEACVVTRCEEVGRPFHRRQMLTA